MRSHFQFPAGVCYLDAASISPRANKAASVAHSAIQSYQHPWEHRNAPPDELAVRVRELAGNVLGARGQDMALVNSVSYGMAVAAANLPIPSGGTVLMMKDDHPSVFLAWRDAASRAGANVRLVSTPETGDWTSAVLRELVSGPCADVVVLSAVHWVDGGILDMDLVASRVKQIGASLVLDATQAAGIVDLGTAALNADFIMFPAYKWLLGPYGLAFLYANPRHHQGTPLELHMGTRRAPALRRAGSIGDFSHAEGARRFERGERDDKILLSAAAAGLELALSWSFSEKHAHLWTLNDELTELLTNAGFRLVRRDFRSPHIISIDIEPNDVVTVNEALEAHSVHVSARRGHLRVSPHVYNNSDDIRTFFTALQDVLS